MSLAFRNEIDVTVWLAGATIADVSIQPRSRPSLTRLFAGKPAASLIAVLPRLFSLCSVAHQVAFLSAIEAAQGRQATPETAHHRLTAVVAERLTELLRSLFLGRLALDPPSAAAVRAMMQATTVLGGASEGASEDLRREAVAQIKATLGALGIAGEGGALVPGSALAVLIGHCEQAALSPPPTEPSFLSAADDLDVIKRLLAEGAAYSDAPALRGQVPETGVWARARREPVSCAATPAVRMEARIVEVARLCAWLDRGGEELDDGVAGYRLGAGQGAAAVECARGRLYHAVVLDEDTRIVTFEFLAPTEWNFHARGPLVRSLKGAKLPAGRRGQDAVRTLVGSFDPCVGFKLDFREVGHA